MAEQPTFEDLGRARGADSRTEMRDQLLARKNGKMVQVRITKRGDGKISTGEYDPIENAHTHHVKGDVLWVPESVARQQEDAGNCELLEDGDNSEAEGAAKRGPGRPRREG